MEAKWCPECGAAMHCWMAVGPLEIWDCPECRKVVVGDPNKQQTPLWTLEQRYKRRLATFGGGSKSNRRHKDDNWRRKPPVWDLDRRLY